MADTDKATTFKIISPTGYFLNIKIITIIIATIRIKILISLTNFSTLIVNGDFSSLIVVTLLAMAPISVPKEVATTIALHLPVLTLVPANTIFTLSDNGVA